MKKSYFSLAVLAILAVAAIVLYALYGATRLNNQDRFSVTGTGTVYAKADIAQLTVGLKTGVKATAAQATEESTQKMNDIIGELKKLDVETKDIQTTDYRLSPVYNWTQDRGQQLQGYEVSQNVTVKIRDLEKIGDIIAKTTEKGANQIGNINFTIDDEYELKNQARQLAIEKAKEKAEMIAKESGLKLGKIKNIYENSVTPMPMYDYSNAKLEMAVPAGMGEAIASPAIEAGQNQVKVEVTLMYEVK